MKTEVYWRSDLSRDYNTYGKGCRYPFDAKNIRIEIEFMDGYFETFEFKVNESEFDSLLIEENKVQEAFISEKKSNFSLTELLEHNNYLYMFNRNLWMSSIKKKLKLLIDYKSIGLLEFFTIFLYEYNTSEETSQFIYDNLKEIYVKKQKLNIEDEEKLIEMIYKINLKLNLYSEEELLNMKTKENIEYFK